MTEKNIDGRDGKKRRFKTALAAVAGGIAVCAAVYAVAFAKSIDSLEKSFEKTAAQLKSQCQSYDEIIAADEAKSLIRLTEQTIGLRTNLGVTADFGETELLKDFADNQRLSGIIILDENLCLVSEYSDGRIDFNDWKENLSVPYVANTANYEKKIYCERVYKYGNCYDMAVVARIDKPGLICCYRHQNSGLLALNKAALESIMSDYTAENGGIVYVIKKGEILSTYDSAVRKGKAHDSAALPCSEVKSEKPERISTERGTFYGAKSYYNKYDIYVFYSESTVLKSCLYAVILALSVYTALCMLIRVVGMSLERKHRTELNDSIETIKAISEIYDVSITVNVRENRFEAIKLSEYMMPMPIKIHTAKQLFDFVGDTFIGDEYKEQFEKFVDLSDVTQRLYGKEFIEFICCTKKGKWISNLLIRKETAHDGSVRSVVLISRNIDEQKKSELEYQEKLKRTTEKAVRANNAKTDFLRRMSHDIRTPINVIMGMVAIGNKYPSDAEKQRYCREKIQLASSMLLELVNDVLFINKVDSGGIELESKPFDLRDIIAEVNTLTEVQANQKGVKYEIECFSAEQCRFFGSPLHLRQILMNISTNAVKYTPSGGCVSVLCREIGKKDGKCVFEFVCRDNGIGMSEEFQKRMFEPFVQENSSADNNGFSGIGLGLAIVKKLTDKMGGSISVRSEKGKGSEFIVTIPLLPDSGVNGEKVVKDVSLDGIKILVAEDNEINMTIAKFALGEKGARVISASDGKQALELWENSEPHDIDVILLDLMMPVMDGYETARRIRNSTRPDAASVPIIAMSANAFEEDVKRSNDAGMDAHVAKPFDANKLAQTILDCINKRNGVVQK